MKKKTIGCIFIVIILAFSACGKNTQTWQELYDLGEKYLLEENYEEAIVAFTSAIELDPKQAVVYVGRGDAYAAHQEQENHLELALADYSQALELDNSIPEAYLSMADVYIQQENYDEALEILKKGEENTNAERKIDEYKNQIEQQQLDLLLKNANEVVPKLNTEEITFFGNPINTLTIEAAEVLLNNNGFPSATASGNPLDVIMEGGDSRSLHRRRSQLFDMNISVYQDYDADYVTSIFYTVSFSRDERIPTDIGICNIFTEDTMSEVLTKLGFPNADEIVNALEKNENSIQLNSTTESGLKYQFWGSELQLYFTEDENVDIITFEFNAENGLVLEECHIFKNSIENN